MTLLFYVYIYCGCMLSLQSCPTLCDPRTVVRRAPLSTGFSRQKYWSGLPCLLQGLNTHPLQYSCLGNSIDRVVWQATVHRVTKCWTWLSNWTHTHTYVHIYVCVYMCMHMYITESLCYAPKALYINCISILKNFLNFQNQSLLSSHSLILSPS